MRPLLLALLSLLLVASPLPAAEPTGEEIARLVIDRPRAKQASRAVLLVLFDGRRGRRERQIRSFWKLQPDARWTVMFALAPPELKHHAFLARDPFDSSRPDDQFLYRPTRGAAHRIPSINRGESFLGSEFTFEDVKKEDRVELGEFDWKLLGRERRGERTLWKVEQVPKTPQLARDLGYGRALNFVDPSIAMRVRVEFFDRQDEPLKFFDFREIEQVDGFWTAKRIEATNQQTGHRSLLIFSEIDYHTPLEDGLFTVRVLESKRGPRLGRRAR